MAAPTDEGTYVLKTDASSRGVGAVLCQQQEGDEKVLAYFSKKLLERQSKYSASELEALAVVLTVKHFAVYLLGGTFILETDQGMSGTAS